MLRLFCWLFFPTVCSAIFNLLSLLLRCLLSSSSLCLSFCSLPCAVCGSRRTCCMPHAVLSLQQEVARPMTKPETETEPETEPCRRVATKTRWDRLDSMAGTHTHAHTQGRARGTGMRCKIETQRLQFLNVAQPEHFPSNNNNNKNICAFRFVFILQPRIMSHTSRALFLCPCLSLSRSHLNCKQRELRSS